MSKIKVSVIVPVYNVQDFLEECVNSLIAQTMDDIEILLIDDGSTDSSGKICDRYAKEYQNIRVVHKVNGGLVDARNAGAKEAKGDYLYFIDSDDFLDHDAIQFLYEEAENKKLDVVLFSAESFSDEQDITFNPNAYRRTQFLNEVKTGKEMFAALYSAGEYFASIPLRFYRGEFFRNGNYQFPHIIHEDEFVAFLSLIEAERVECVEHKFYKRRYRKGSIMTSEKAYKSAMGYIETWKALMTFYYNTESEDKEIYFKFTQGFLKMVMNLYNDSFDWNEKRQLGAVRQEINKILKKEKYKLKRSTRWFLEKPFVYDLYRAVLFVKRCLPFSKKRRGQIKILCDSVIRPYIVRFFCQDKQCVILIGTPIHGNLGDQAIVYAENKFFQNFKKRINIIEISSGLYLKHKELYEKVIASQDIIVIDGGGSMGTLWIGNEYRFRDIIQRFPKNRIYIFPQTAYFENSEIGKKELEKSQSIYSKHDKLTIFCRDKNTHKFIKDNFSSNPSYYIPDMVLSLGNVSAHSNHREGVLLCLREDIECVVSQEEKNKLERILIQNHIGYKKTSTLTGRYIDKYSREEELEKKWAEFSKAKLVITDRLHAMFFCAITGTNCIALDNVSNKVKGGYEWISQLPYIYFLENEEISEILILRSLEKDERNTGVCLQEKFDDLQKIIENEGINEN